MRRRTAKQEPPPPPQPPGPRAWKRADRLTPVHGPQRPEFVSDGSGLPFQPAVLDAPATPLDPGDPPVQVLLSQLRHSRRLEVPDDDRSALAPWRMLARTNDAALFGSGRPPGLITVAVSQDSRRGNWSCLAVSTALALRAAREGIRASSWRPDPTNPPRPDDTELRVLVTEQTHATGKLAHGRMLPPDLYLDGERIVLRCFIRPLGGFQNRALKNAETPAIVELGEPLGERLLLDGAVYAPAGPAPSR